MKRPVLTAVLAVGIGGLLGVTVIHSASPQQQETYGLAPVDAGPLRPPREPWPHTYAAVEPDGTVLYRQLALCGPGCFTLADEATNTTTRYTYDGTQWRTERTHFLAGVICPDGHAQGANILWATDDLVHFYSDTEEGVYCESTGIMKPDSLTFTLTPAY